MFNFKQNNKGSAIITVVISMLFVMTLGAALLFAAYTGYSIELNQQSDKANFYNASSAMEDMRLGIQSLLSESTATAYTGVLTGYTTSAATPDYDPQADFDSKIVTALLSKTVTINSVAVHYFTSTDGGITITGYNAAAMKTLVDADVLNDATITLNVKEAATYTDNGTVINNSLKALNVVYVKGGYESIIKSDITITMPDFYASSPVTSGINEYAIIANSLTETGNNSGSGFTVSGSVFVGSAGITMPAGSNIVTFSNGDLICKGPISVGASSLSFNADSNELWASEITVGASGILSLNGNVNVADDLVINGGGASVTLAKTYFGFGNSATDSSKSSSILVSSRTQTSTTFAPSSLSISGLTKLSLAGVSFIDISDESLKDQSTGTDYSSTTIPMGESMSTKADQLAYLVPARCISNYETNPYYVEANTAVETPVINTTTPVFDTTIAGYSSKTLANYIGTHVIDNKYSNCEIKTLYKHLGSATDPKIAYVFLVFRDKKYANAYFMDYFNAEPDNIKQYLSLYTSIIGQATTTDTAGNTYYTPSGGSLTLNAASDTVAAANAQLRYDNLTWISPYTFFVNTTALADVGTATPLVFKNSSDVVVAIVANGDYNYNGSPNNIRLIISSGNVTVSSLYTGLIMSGGNVAVNADVNSGTLDASLLDATATDGTTTYKLSDFIKNSDQLFGTASSANDAWNLNSLVFYENWKKN